MTKEQAEYIKELRTGKIQHSWRSISNKVVEKYPSLITELGWDLDSATENQLLGRDLCSMAGEILGGEFDD